MVRLKPRRGDGCPDFTLAFHNAVISNPTFYSVIHTASPHYVRNKRDDPPFRGKRASTSVAQAMSDEFSPDWFYW